MGKARLRKKIEGYKKQLRKHGEKYKEAKARGAIESMVYMEKEMMGYAERLRVLKKRLKPAHKKKHNR